MRKKNGRVTRAIQPILWLVEQMALVLQGSLLVRYAPAPVADVFCASRLDGDSGGVFGAMGQPGRGVDTAGIVERAAPTAD